MSSDSRGRGLPSDAGDRAWQHESLQISGAAAGAAPEVFVAYAAASDFIAECEARVIRTDALERPHLALIADPQNGRHATVRWLARRHRPFRVPSTDTAVVPCVVTELPLQAKKRGLRDAFARALGLIECASWPDLAAAYKAACVRLLVLRNAHEILDLDPAAQRDTLDQLHDFASQAKVHLVFVATRHFLDVVAADATLSQLTHRMRLPRWTPSTLTSLLVGLQAAWEVRNVELATYADLVCDAGDGRIGSIVRQLRYALDDGRVQDAPTFLKRLLSRAGSGV